MQSMAQTFPISNPAQSSLTTFKTTLYELIEAIAEEIKPEEERLVTETVLHLFETGKVKFSGAALDI